MISCAAIVAIDEERGIGIGGDLPWRIPADLKFFRRITTGDEAGENGVIMGRVTWDSIPEKFRPLRGRKNIVLSRGSLDLPEGVLAARSLPEAMEHGSELNRLFVIGGESIYREAIAGSTCDELFVTRVQGSFRCDRFFPEFETSFRLQEELGEGEDNGHAYRWERWERR